MKVPFNRVHLLGTESVFINEALSGGHLSGDGRFTKECHQWLEKNTGTHKALLTHSCTAALEMAAILADIQPGDEVIMPSYTFVSTANAFVLRGGVPVFVDVRKDTLNIDETLVESAITKKTKAIVPVHYAGASCEMDTLNEIAKQHRLLVIEDAAQGVHSYYKGRALGSIGDLGTYSFHQTKNIIAGEGGALLVNAPYFIDRAEVIREKGTDRSRFLRDEIDKYTWRDIGSSYLPSELTAAILWPQLEAAEVITSQRLKSWLQYHDQLAELEQAERLARPHVPAHCQHNGHIYFILLPSVDIRDKLHKELREEGIMTSSHYVPLHYSPGGMQFGRTAGKLTVTESIADRLLRLPLWNEMDAETVSLVTESVKKHLTRLL